MNFRVSIFLLVALIAGTGVRCDSMSAARIKNEHVYFVILAGGNGERLWPLSTQKKPKQLLTLGYEQTLLEQTINRVQPLAHSKKNIWISTTRNHEQAICACAGDQVGTVVVEPGRCNTGPAILYCCYELYKHDPEAQVIFLPADAFIPESDSALFADYVQQVVDFLATHDALALFGIKPTYPATGYGYIEFDAAQNDTITGLRKVLHLHEKPAHDVAQQYLHMDTMLWNIGMFGGKVSFFMESFQAHAPELFAAVTAFVKGDGVYEDAPNISIDYAVLEKSANVWVLPTDFAWCDVGNISVFLSLQDQYGISHDNIINIDAHNNLVHAPGKQVSLIGVDDMCVVSTGDVLLITKRDQAEQVKSVVLALKENCSHRYL